MYQEYGPESNLTTEAVRAKDAAANTARTSGDAWHRLRFRQILTAKWFLSREPDLHNQAATGTVLAADDGNELPGITMPL